MSTNLNTLISSLPQQSIESHQLTISQLLSNAFKQAFIELGFSPDTQVLLVSASKPEFGDFQVNGVMGAAKAQKINPRDLAEQVIIKATSYLGIAAKNIGLNQIVEKLEIAGPGFINITLSNSYLANYVAGLSSENKYGVNYLQHKPQKVVVDLSSPNLAKEMHVGHLRSTVIGDALARMFEYMGDEVIRQNHVGDWGTQFGMLLAYLEESLVAKTHADPYSTDLDPVKSQNQLNIKNDEFTVKDLERFYQNAKKRFDEDPIFADKARSFVVKLQQESSTSNDENLWIRQLWEMFRDESLKHCQRVYDMLHINLTMDDVRGESAYEPDLPRIVDCLQEKGLLTQSDGAKCIFFAPGELSGGEDTPFIVQKKDGGYLYSTTDLAAINYRVEKLGADRIVYVVDARQAFHFKQLFIVSQKASLVKQYTKLEHAMFGTMMNEDGRPFKTRDGGTIKLIDLVSEAISRARVTVKQRNPDWSTKKQENLAQILAIDAIKYADLAKNRNSDYIFSFDKMLAFDGNTAPYLLYAYTRIQSVLRKSEAAKLQLGANVAISEVMNTEIEEVDNMKVIITDSAEHKLALHLAKFADTLSVAVSDAYPHYICQYLYDLAGLFMQFYESCPILNAVSIKQKNSRLYLASLTAQILKLGLNDLLGIKVIDDMRM